MNHLHYFQLEKLSDKQSQPESQLKFITEAWLQASSVTCEHFLLASLLSCWF